MRVQYFAAYIFLTGIMCVGSSSASDGDKLRQGSELLTKAVSLQDIRAQGAKPFHFQAKIEAQRIVSKPVTGSYDEIWMSPEKWRREINFSGFDQVEVGSSNSKWVSRNAGFRPRVAYLTSLALENFFTPEAAPSEKITSLRQKKKKGLLLQCVQLEVGHSDRELCFDPSGVLAMEEHLNQRFEYADFGKFGEKIFPHSIRVFEADYEVLNLQIQDPEAPPVQAVSFDHPASALQMAPCERWPAEPENKIVPQYPQLARQGHQQGTVVLYVVVGADGRVDGLKVLESAGESLDKSASDAVRQWTYAPMTCGAASLPSEIEVRTSYTLSGY